MQSKKHERLMVKMVQLFLANPSQSYGASPDMWDRTVSAATWHRWVCHP